MVVPYLWQYLDLDDLLLVGIVHAVGHAVGIANQPGAGVVVGGVAVEAEVVVAVGTR